jgi:hypothetical protein
MSGFQRLSIDTGQFAGMVKVGEVTSTKECANKQIFLLFHSNFLLCLYLLLCFDS